MVPTNLIDDLNSEDTGLRGLRRNPDNFLIEDDVVLFNSSEPVNNVPVQSTTQNQSENENNETNETNETNENNKENEPPTTTDDAFRFSRFLGLKQLAYVLAYDAKNTVACGDHEECEKALNQFELARLIDPGHDYVNNEAIVYEEMGRYKEAEVCYLTAIENSEDTFAMYNLGDLYEKGLCGAMKADKAICYYEMGAMLNDPAALSKTLLFWYAGTTVDPKTCHNTVKLGEFFVKMTEQEKIAKANDYPDDVFDRDLTTGFEDHTFQQEQFKDFVKSQTNLVMVLQLEKVRDNTTLPALRNRSVACLDVLYKDQEYLSYSNKMALFTRLNNLHECAVCYEEKINIDVSCGHDFCGDCYARVYRESCPLCRAPC